MVKAPQSAEELADLLHRNASHSRTIALSGNGTKHLMAGAIEPADESLSTSGLNRILEYEPHDLTIGVEAGIPWEQLSRKLAEHRQMIPLDPPFASGATVGGVIASNSNGSRRRLYGTARDVVIGMQFATLEGKLVQSGGMVVKNVAGLDMAKLMIGSFGTLAAITRVNFKLIPMADLEKSFLLQFPTLADATAARDHILRSPLQPAAIDLLNPSAGVTLGKSSWLLAIRVNGNAASMDRYEHELASHGDGVAFDNSKQETLWRHVQEFTPKFLEKRADGAVVRVSCTLKELAAVIESLPGPAVARAGSGVCYGYFERSQQSAEWLAGAVKRGWKAVIEFAPAGRKRELDLWPAPGGDFEIMRRVKQLFDPGNVLNRGRLYNRI